MLPTCSKNQLTGYSHVAKTMNLLQITPRAVSYNSNHPGLVPPLDLTNHVPLIMWKVYLTCDYQHNCYNIFTLCGGYTTLPIGSWFHHYSMTKKLHVIKHTLT
jgi:hypothetical protein